MFSIRGNKGYESLVGENLGDRPCLERHWLKIAWLKKPERRNASWKEDRFVKLSHHWGCESSISQNWLPNVDSNHEPSD